MDEARLVSGLVAPSKDAHERATVLLKDLLSGEKQTVSQLLKKKSGRRYEVAWSIMHALPPLPVAEPVRATPENAMLIASPDGSMAFDISLNNDIFSDLACTVQLSESGRVTAVFRVQDDNSRRLLEAEAGRLRVQLEARGLRVDKVSVEQVSIAGPLYNVP